jgi:hypothetical protein
VVVTVATGTLQLRDFVHHLSAIREDPLHRRGMPELADLRAVTNVEASADEIADFARMVNNLRESAGAAPRLAIVAEQRVVFGLSRMFVARSDPGPATIGVFRDIRSACEWLGVPEP